MLFGGFKGGRGYVEGLAVADVQLDLVKQLADNGG
jgi:hypothetical protein